MPSRILTLLAAPPKKILTAYLVARYVTLLPYIEADAVAAQGNMYDDDIKKSSAVVLKPYPEVARKSVFFSQY